METSFSGSERFPLKGALGALKDVAALGKLLQALLKQAVEAYREEDTIVAILLEALVSHPLMQIMPLRYLRSALAYSLHACTRST